MGNSSLRKKSKPTMTYIGTAVIIVNKDFHNPRDCRNGADKDLQMMKEMFTKLNFKVKDYENQDAQEMLTIIQDATKWEESYEPECFTCVISTHGGEVDINKVKQSKATGRYSSKMMPVVYGSDHSYVTIDEITSEVIKGDSAFTRKTKLFFIQACRSRKGVSYVDGFDQGMLSQRNESGGNQGMGDGSRDGKSEFDAEKAGVGDLSKRLCDSHLDDESIDAKGRHDDEIKEDPKGNADTNAMPSPFEVAQFECPDDCLIMQPISSGKYALRTSDEGSFMLNYMHKNMAMLLDNCPLQQYLTKVCQDMAERDLVLKIYKAGKNTTIKMCNTITHRLTQDVRFGQTQLAHSGDGSGNRWNIGEY